MLGLCYPKVNPNEVETEARMVMLYPLFTSLLGFPTSWQSAKSLRVQILESWVLIRQ